MMKELQYRVKTRTVSQAVKDNSLKSIKVKDLRLSTSMRIAKLKLLRTLIFYSLAMEIKILKTT